MRASTNIQLKDRNTMTIEDFKGIDLTSSPQRVAANRATDAVNIIYEDGLIHKRKGWRQKFTSLGQAINGLFEYKNDSQHVLLIHAGTSIYEIHPDTEYIRKISSDTMTIQNKQSNFFMNKGRCYIVCGDLLVYGCWNGSKYYKLCRITDAPDLYIPTTTINIDAGTEDTQVALYESPNLLTSFRKNSLVGNNNGTSSVWVLDSPILRDSEVVIEVTDYYSSGNFNSWKIHNYFYDDSPKYDHTDVPLEKIEEWESSGKIFLVSEGGNKIIGTLNFGGYRTVDGEVRRTNATITLDYTPKPLGDGSENIVVTFRAASNSQEKLSDRITRCSFGTLFGPDGNTNRLFLSGNYDYPNRVFYSEFNDYTYFPDVNYLSIGGEDSAVNGFSRLLDNTMAILKEKNEQDATIFYVTGTLQHQYDSTGNLESGRAIFSVSSGGVGEGNVSPYTSANLAGDALMLSRNGVFGMVLTENIATNARYVKERSYSINKKLKQHNLKEAVGTVFENRYYLSVDGVCYVADAQHKYYRDGNDLDQSFNYEWWYWENVAARSWAVINDHLWFGTKDGLICAFDTEDHVDRIFYDSEEGDISINVTENRMALNSNYSELLSEGDTIRFCSGTKAYVSIVEDISCVQDGDVSYYTTDEEGISLLYEGMVVYAGRHEFYEDGDSTTDTLSVQECIVQTIDRGACRFTMNVALPENDTINLYYLIESKDLSITNIENGYFQLRELWGGSVLKLCWENENVLPIARITQKQPVVARWITPYFDMGNNLYGKTLLRMTVSADAGSGHFRFGYETKQMVDFRHMKGIDIMSSDDFSLEHFSFYNDFASAYTIKTHVRNFNYIRFMFLSEEDSDFHINGLTVLYKINKMNRGVR